MYLDCSNISENEFENQFPTIKQNCLKVGINPPQQPIPVTPAAHYFCGGISVNHYGETKLIKNLKQLIKIFLN